VDVPVPGALTRIAREDAPVSVTTLTAEDIRVTPARNLLDLIEAYVPGAMWQNHNEGPHPYIRGITSNRNDKFLLLLNGHPMNQKAHSGAVDEIFSWDLSDIERVEIIRGPGSVTYGPGAVMGVIRLTTRDARSASGLRAGAQYVPAYHSRSVHAGYGRAGALSLYAFASVASTRGLLSPRHLEPAASGVVDYRTEDQQDYLADIDYRPQYEVHLEGRLRDWTLWTRYTTSGGYYDGSKSSFFSRGPLENWKGLRDRHATVRLENRRIFSDA
jgi:outer membrane receptor protein involved in Fe transport